MDSKSQLDLLSINKELESRNNEYIKKIKRLEDEVIQEANKSYDFEIQVRELTNTNKNLQNENSYMEKRLLEYEKEINKLKEQSKEEIAHEIKELKSIIKQMSKII